MSTAKKTTLRWNMSQWQGGKMFCNAVAPRYLSAVLDLNVDELLTG